MLPGLDSIEVCWKLKADSVTHSVSIIMVIAKGEESDIVLGLGGRGLCDQTVSPRELMARIKSALRRGTLRDDNAQVSSDGLVIDVNRHEVPLEAERVVFTAMEF